MSKSKAPVKAGITQPEASAAEDVSSFLDQVKRMPPAERRAGERGRLIFAMDATMSRQPTWDRALQIQSEMFIETEKIGGLDVQLMYFRGFNECRASKWDPLGYPPIDELVATNFSNQVNILDIPISGTNIVYATNFTVITTLATNNACWARPLRRGAN